MPATLIPAKETKSWHLQRHWFPGCRPNPRILWDRLGSAPYRFWLDSGELSPPSGHRTLLAWGDPLWVFQGKNNRGEIKRQGCPANRIFFDDPTEVLRNFLQGVFSATRTQQEADGENAFPGGVLGFWSYEAAHYFERLSHPSGLKVVPDDGGDHFPDFVWVMPRFWAVLSGQGTLLLHLTDGSSSSERDQFESWRRQIPEIPEELPRSPQRPVPLPRHMKQRLGVNRSVYLAKTRRIQRYIAAGDIYQANLTHRLDFSWPPTSSPENLFDVLRHINPSPYSALMVFPDFSLVSSSPELLLRVRGRHVETRPIAGTRPRGGSLERDKKLSGDLFLSPKERAEHIMLVDLERNDLGRVCEPGTVKVSDRMVLEKYSHVMHIVSQVEGRLRPGTDGFHAVKALFPGGTITGCPKIRCCQILQELEEGPRGPFFGSAGWMGLNGDMDLNILIRTALIQRGRLSLRVGSGIVADSIPRKEYEETLHKARAILTAYTSIAMDNPTTSPG